MLESNCRQHRQAANTPFADGDFGDLIHWEGTGDMLNGILEGKPLPELELEEDIVKEYIKGMAVSNSAILNSVDTYIDIDTYRNFRINKRETTVT